MARIIIIASLIICSGVASAYAGGFMLLHVGPADSNGAGAVCSASSGQLDFSACSNIIYIPALIH